MIISLNWLKKYVDIDIPTHDLVELIGSRLVEVEETIDLASRYKDAVIVRVEEHHKVDGSDHLNLCQIDVGKDELVQIVCGANNVTTNMLAVWLPPKSIVPETYGTDDEFVLEARKLMGQMSNGMLASIRELGLGEDHDGIVEIAPDFAKPGDRFAEKFELDDTLLDIDPKSLTHRPDCFGVIGFAREVAGILGKKFEEPKVLASTIKPMSSGELDVEIVDPKLCPRYSAAVVDMSQISDTSYPKSSKYLSVEDTYFCRVGMRSISRIVDITNYLMLDTGQPLHAFDYDKFVKVGGSKTPKIIVRTAKKDEKLELLDGKTIEMSEGDIVITSNGVPVALAGAMGGANTEIDNNTRRVIVESATFNLYNMRGTQFRHGIFSEAITRFTKGQPAGLTAPVLNEAVALLGGKVLDIVDAYPASIKFKPIKVAVEAVNNTLGSSYTFDEIISTLENVGFKVKLVDESIETTSPWWRTDIHIAEDVIEEIGRIGGYDTLTFDLPKRSFAAPAPDELGNFKSKIRQILSSLGANEALTYSFVSGKLLESAGQDPKNSYKIINSISPELQYVRQSIMPSLLEKVRPNIKDKFEGFAIYEINQVYRKGDGLTDEKVPFLRNNLGCVLTGDYYVAKKYVTELLSRLGVEAQFVALDDGICSKPLELKRGARILSADSKIRYGSIGEFKPGVRRSLKLPENLAGFELNIDRIFDNAVQIIKIKCDSDYPEVERDMTFQVGVDVEYIRLENLIRDSLEQRNLQFKIIPVSVYQGNDKKSKNISFKLSFASFEKTLKTEEISHIIDQLAKCAQTELSAKVI